jgi:hypothetical protein
VLLKKVLLAGQGAGTQTIDEFARAGVVSVGAIGGQRERWMQRRAPMADWYFAVEHKRCALFLSALSLIHNLFDKTQPDHG